MLSMTPSKKVLTLFVALCVAAVPAAAFSATTTVTARSSSWGPARVTIERGDSVKWSNTSSFLDHSVRAYGGNWTKDVRLGPRSSVTQRFRSTGKYRYYCRLHGYKSPGQPCEGMCGVVRVVRPS